MARVINGSDIQAIYDISKEVRKYAESLKQDVHRLVSNHRRVGASWSGKQYDEFTEIIEEARKKLDSQAERLTEIAAAVKEDAQLLTDAHGYKLGG